MIWPSHEFVANEKKLYISNKKAFCIYNRLFIKEFGNVRPKVKKYQLIDEYNNELCFYGYLL
jgi:hypothetical protein